MPTRGRIHQLKLPVKPKSQDAACKFFDRHKYEAGKNTLLNRMSQLNHEIKKQWLELSLDSFKVICKKLFLDP